ncbi:MAG: cyclic nucleotide-binding/CBS domain-containing protein [Candidatus Hydrothermarchaeota archaeon]
MNDRVTVKDAMSRIVYGVDKESTVKEAVKIMVDKNVGAVVIFDKEEPVGMLTEKDILENIVLNDAKASEVKVKEIMSTPLVTIDPDAELQEASRLMSKWDIKRLVVVGTDKVVGIITEGDIARICPIIVEELESKKEVSLSVTGTTPESGICEHCGGYTDTLTLISGMLVCDVCKEEIEGEQA